MHSPDDVLPDLTRPAPDVLYWAGTLHRPLSTELPGYAEVQPDKPD